MEQQEPEVTFDLSWQEVGKIAKRRQSLKTNEAVMIELNKLQQPLSAAGERLTNFYNSLPTRASHEVKVDSAIREHELWLQMVYAEFEWAFVASIIQKDAYSSFLKTLKSRISDQDPDEMRDLGIFKIYDFYHKVGEKYGLILREVTLDSPNIN